MGRQTPTLSPTPYWSPRDTLRIEIQNKLYFQVLFLYEFNKQFVLPDNTPGHTSCITLETAEKGSITFYENQTDRYND